MNDSILVVTHNHPEGIKGAQATAAAVFLVKNGALKEEIGDYIRSNYYLMGRPLEKIRRRYHFRGDCQGSVPQSILAFLESTSFETAIRNAISLGGDADTVGTITGSNAWAYYGRDGITEDMLSLWERAKRYVPEELIERANVFQTFCNSMKGELQA